MSVLAAGRGSIGLRSGAPVQFLIQRIGSDHSVHQQAQLGRGDAPARARRLPDVSREGDRGGREVRTENRIQAHRHRQPVRERGERGTRGEGERGAEGAGLRHHQAVEQRPRLRSRPARVREEPAPARARLCRPIPHPLARIAAQGRVLEGARGASAPRLVPRYRREQLHRQAPR